MAAKSHSSAYHIQLYRGFGSNGRFVLCGHVFRKAPVHRPKYGQSLLRNSLEMIRLFVWKPAAGLTIKLEGSESEIVAGTRKDGFFELNWEGKPTHGGWQPVQVSAWLSSETVATAEGEMYVPEASAYGIISDIDDTVLVSHSTRFRKRMREVLLRHARSRKIFPEAVRFYSLLASQAQAKGENPFFYISSSEWNLYKYLVELFRFRSLPKGVFLLSPVKRWFQMLRTGKTNHQKLDHMVAVLNLVDDRPFVLLGDNSQADPIMYARLAAMYPGRISAIYIRMVRKSKIEHTMATLAIAQSAGVAVCFYNHTSQAIAHAREAGIVSVAKPNLFAD